MRHYGVVSNQHAFQTFQTNLKLNLNFTTVEPPKINTFFISLEASHNSNISKYYSYIVKSNSGFEITEEFTALPVMTKNPAVVTKSQTRSQ